MTNKKISIIDYGSGNQKSIYNLIKFIGYDPLITYDRNEIEKSDFLVLPGVGSYFNLMKKLHERNLIEILNEQVLKKQKLYLGICVGMQILSNKGFEFYTSNGLGWIDGEVNKIESGKLNLPHIGWNNLKIKKNHQLLKGLDEKSDFYFVNSYCFKNKNDEDILAESEYNENFPSIVNKKNIFGVQFHPEKSQFFGKLILENFFNIL